MDKKKSSSSKDCGHETLKQSTERRRRFSNIVARAWSDEQFKKKLLTKPEEVFKEYALDLPKGVKVQVVENTPHLMHFVLPMKPQGVGHLALDRLSVHILDSPCHGHEHSDTCASGATDHSNCGATACGASHD